MEQARLYNAAVDFVDRNVSEGRGEKIAYQDPERTLTYGELLDSASRLGSVLAKLGIEQENRIAIIMLDTVEFPILFWGAIRAGVVPVLLNTRLTAAQYRYMLGDMRAKAVFVSGPLLPLVQEATAGLPGLKHIVVAGEGAGTLPQLGALIASEREGAAPAATSPDEVAFWLYSSGTTGDPKGVMHVHSSLSQIARLAGQGHLGIKEDDVIFSASKAFFAFGMSNSIICPAWAGATAVLYPERPTPQSIFEILGRYQPTMFFGVPTLYAAILRDPACTPQKSSARLRLCFSAGEPLPQQLGEEWKARFGLDIVNGVGSSEMGHFFLSNMPDAVDYKISGVPVNGYDIKLVDDEGHEVADGELGELLVRGPSAAAGYWNQQQKSRHTFEGEWTRTGDKYTRQNDAYTYHGRGDDIFKVSGIWVSPFEVESALIDHPSVVEAAVVPAEDADGLTKPKAFVVLNDDGSRMGYEALLEDLQSHVKRSIGVWKYPRWIEFVESLPKTATGKIKRDLLRKSANSDRV